MLRNGYIVFLQSHYTPTKNHPIKWSGFSIDLAGLILHIKTPAYESLAPAASVLACHDNAPRTWTSTTGTRPQLHVHRITRAIGKRNNLIALALTRNGIKRATDILYGITVAIQCALHCNISRI